MPQSASLTIKYNGLVRVLSSTISIAQAFDPKLVTAEQPGHPYKQFQAIWDTGASASVITQKVVDDLGLKPIGMTNVHHAQGTASAEVYLVNIALPNNVGFAGVKVTKGILKGTDGLVGMDIIGRGDFAVSNFNGKTVFSFRVPSISCADYTGKVPITVPTKPGRNDPCPCDSGKKFKKCCGA